MRHTSLLWIVTGVGQVVLQVAAATPCAFAYGIEKSYWPSLYAEVCIMLSAVFMNNEPVGACIPQFTVDIFGVWAHFCLFWLWSCNRVVFVKQLAEYGNIENLLLVQQMEAEFTKWMKFYGRKSSCFHLEKGDFLDDVYLNTITSATWVFCLIFSAYVWLHISFSPGDIWDIQWNVFDEDLDKC